MELVLYILWGIVLIQLFYYLFILARFAFYTPGKSNIENEQAVSVIICARNDSANLLNNLPAILEQDHTHFEVILVNDGSTDDTEQVLNQLQEKYDHLKIVRTNDGDADFLGKKKALKLGIETARHEILILTDADCKPASNHWLKLMANNYRNGIEVVLGYSPQLKRKSGSTSFSSNILDKLVRFDTVMTGLQYFSFALMKTPFMGVGRNLSYTHTLYSRVKGFDSHKQVISGDDDLFINNAASASNTAIEINRDSFMHTVSKDTWSAYYHQKLRHTTTGVHYKWQHKLLLGIYWGSAMLVYPVFIILLFSYFPPLWIVGPMIIRYVILNIILYGATKKLGDMDVLVWLPFMDFLYITFYITLALSQLKRKNPAWNPNPISR